MKKRSSFLRIAIQLSVAAVSVMANPYQYNGQATAVRANVLGIETSLVNAGPSGLATTARNDTFAIRLSNGYNASGRLAGGNIQLHPSQ